MLEAKSKFFGIYSLKISDQIKKNIPFYKIMNHKFSSKKLTVEIPNTFNQS